MGAVKEVQFWVVYSVASLVARIRPHPEGSDGTMVVGGLRVGDRDLDHNLITSPLTFPRPSSPCSRSPIAVPSPETLSHTPSPRKYQV